MKQSMLMKQFALAGARSRCRRRSRPTLLKMDLAAPCRRPMLPFILIFLFMVLFDTLGTLIGVCRAGRLDQDNSLPRASQALVSDAVGTVAGAALGTSTVTSFIESAAGVEQGGRTGPDRPVRRRAVSAGFVLQPDDRHGRQLSADHRPGPGRGRLDDDPQRREDRLGELCRGDARVPDHDRHPADVTRSPTAWRWGSSPIRSSSCCAGQGRDVKWLMYVMAAVLVAYFLLVRRRAESVLQRRCWFAKIVRVNCVVVEGSYLGVIFGATGSASDLGRRGVQHWQSQWHAHGEWEVIIGLLRCFRMPSIRRPW